MTGRLRMSTISSTERRNDLHLTTTGIGHAYKPTVSFPPKHFQTKRSKPLPRNLIFPCCITVDDVYGTTTGSTHDYKPGYVYPHSLHKKAPSLMKVNYTLDTTTKLNQKPWCPPLTMGNQSSEMHDKYTGKTDSTSDVLSHPPESIVHQTLRDYFSEGPTKDLSATDTIPGLHGKNFKAEDQAILQQNEPYLTTNNWYHRRFTVEELNKYPKKDIATYWQCEDYPKAWGFGTKETNPLPKGQNNNTDPGPMRDRMVFRTATSIPRLPQSLTPLSNWLKPTYASSYTNPPEEKRQHLFTSPVQPAFKQTAKDASLLETVPSMYDTYNMSYGQVADRTVL